MKLRIGLASVFVPACLALVACGDGSLSQGAENGGAAGLSTGGSTGNGGASSSTGNGGSSSSTGGSPSSTGGKGSGGAGSGGTTIGGGGSDATGGKAAGGASTGGASAGATGAGGKSSGGAPGPDAGAGGRVAPDASAGGSVGGAGGSVGGAGGSVGGGSGSWVEDDGIDCTVSGLPDASALTKNAKLPDPFKKLDGTRMASKSEWHCRREEIKQLGEKFAYGAKGAIPTTTGTVSDTSITVNVTAGGKSTKFSAKVSLPKTGTAPYPAVIVYGGMAADTTTIQGEGVAIINFDPYSCGKEGTGRSAKAGAFYDIAGSSSTTGLLVAWGWGVSRIIDVIAQSDGKILKATAIGVTGCSRFGKGAIIAGVFDQRVALTMPVESGSAGVPIWRGIPGEGAQSLSSAYGEQPWFGDAFSAFTSDPTKAPLDTHEAVAMVAPRGLFIMDNPHIANLGPKSAHAAALAAAEVYKALGAGDNITYYSDIADGGHCAIRPEWKAPLQQNIRKHLLKTGTDPGVIKASSKATAKAADWIDWTTPTLN